MKNLRIVFFGTPNIAVYVLEELENAGIVPTLVVTAPDKPQGRNLVLTPPPVKVWATERGIACIQPVTYKNNPELIALKDAEWDLFIIAAHGRLVPKDIIEIPKHGTLNVHPSLLPKLRGPSPIRSAILQDMRETGVSIMLVDDQLDHGPIVAQANVELKENDWPPRGRVFDEMLARRGGELLAEVIPAWIAGTITATPQNDDEVTHCVKITKDMGELDLTADPYQNLLKIRAFDGWPGTFFFIEKNGKSMRVKVTDAELSEDGSLRILRVIPEGKREMAYEDFTRGS